MTVFVDTSAILAAVDADEDFHSASAEALDRLLERTERLITTNYVIVETLSLVQRRLGIEPMRQLQASLIPAFEIVWVDQAVHGRGVAALLAARSRRLSLVDCVSFEVMRERGIDTAVALDDDFKRQGFGLIP